MFYSSIKYTLIYKIASSIYKNLCVLQYLNIVSDLLALYVYVQTPAARLPSYLMFKTDFIVILNLVFIVYQITLKTTLTHLFTLYLHLST